jgi:hypothetical protein
MIPYPCCNSMKVGNFTAGTALAMLCIALDCAKVNTVLSVLLLTTHKARSSNTQGKPLAYACY